MTLRKKITVALLSSIGIALVLFVVLVYHVANAKPIENANIQISRIDFDRPFDSLTTIEIKQKLHSIKGVKSDIIVKNNVVVYFHDNSVTDSKKVFSELMNKGNYKAQRFIVPAALASNSVCPVMKKDSFKYKFAQWVRNTF